MSGPSWLIDSKRIATKIKNASGMLDPSRLKWISNPTKVCPRCNHIIDNGDVVQEWPGLPKGVKFDPSDPELISHLIAKVGIGGENPHPFINEFIPTVEEEDGICYTHPQKLPGVKKDGSISHFFHRTFKAYNTGTRKRRKINTDDFGDVRWHKTGKTKPVLVDGRHLGCKKIMVLYMGRMKGEKPKKTNWVMHQYHLGTGEDEMDGEYVVSKIFYQKQAKPSERNEQDLQMEEEVVLAELDPSPEMDINEQGHVDAHKQTYEQDLCIEMQAAAVESDPSPAAISTSPEKDIDELDQIDRHMQTSGQSSVHNAEENQMHPKGENLDDEGEQPVAETKWWEGESQYLLDSQQLAEQIAICEEFLQSQSSCPGETKKNTSKLSDYAHLSPEVLKRDLEECQKLVSVDHAATDDILVSVDHAATEIDSQDFRLSQLEFGSQDSFLAWPESKVAED